MTKKETETGACWAECKVEEIVEALETIIRTLQMEGMEYNHSTRKRKTISALTLVVQTKKEKEGVYDDATQN